MKQSIDFYIGKTRIRITYWFVLILCVYAYFSKNSIYVFLAMTAHELVHIFFITLFKGSINQINLSISQIHIISQKDYLKNFEKVIISLSGPLLNLIFALISYKYNKDFMATNLVIGIFQLLPIVTLDGGEAMSVILIKYKRLQKFISFLLSFLIFFIGIFLIIYTKYNFSLLIVGIYLIYLSVMEC